MAVIDFEGIRNLLAQAHDQGRSSLFEYECYQMQSLMGAEAAPESRFIPAGTFPTQADLDAIPGSKVVLKVVSEDITHKTDARGIRIVANEIGAVEAAFELMTLEVPVAYATFLERESGLAPEPLRGLATAELAHKLSERIRGILLCSFKAADATGFATELYVGCRSTAEFGPIISAGLGGVEMEILARETRKGAAVAIAPTGTVDGTRFFELFQNTLSYQRLSGRMRGSRRLIDDEALLECFESFITVANHFSEANPDADFHIHEMEVNPFSPSGARLAPLDGVCSFKPAFVPALPRPIHKIGNLLRPQSAAIVGVSERSMNMGRIILNNLFSAGFPRDKALVVRPGAEEIDGARCVPSIAELPEKVDLFVVAVGAPQVPEVVNQLIEHDRANAVILIPGGLGEKEGSQDLAHQLRQKIQDAHATNDGGPVFVGGNSLGIISHPGRYDTMFIPETKLAKSRGEHTRRTCFISQSGAFVITNLSRLPWFDPAYALSIGNQIDLTASDYLNYIKDDPDIEVFAIYMEGFQTGDGLAFATAVRDTVALGKDVVFYKAGRTTEGRSATAGHTAKVAGDYAVCEAALIEAGALMAEDFSEFSDLLRLAVRLRGKKVLGTGLVALSNAGFESVGMADSIKQERAELHLVSFASETADRLQRTLASHRLDGLVDVKNPFDITPMATDAAYVDLIETILADPGVDALVAGIVPLTPAVQTLPAGRIPHESITNPESIAKRLPEVARGQDKPIVGVVDSGSWFDPLADQLGAGGIPVFRSADRAVKVLCKFVDVRLRQNRREQ